MTMTLREWLETRGSLGRHLGCQGRVVFTEEDVERCAEALFADERWGDWGGLLPGGKDNYIRKARLMLTAAHGIVADEVVEVRDAAGGVSLIPVRGRSDCEGPCYLRAEDGDTVYVVRKEIPRA